MNRDELIETIAQCLHKADGGRMEWGDPRMDPALPVHYRKSANSVLDALAPLIESRVAELKAVNRTLDELYLSHAERARKAEARVTELEAERPLLRSETSVWLRERDKIKAERDRLRDGIKALIVNAKRPNEGIYVDAGHTEVKVVALELIEALLDGDS